MATRQSLAKLQRDLKQNVNTLLGTSYTSITQFKKHFGLKNIDDTWDYLEQQEKLLKEKKNEMEVFYIKKKS
jgi:hypothetical protein